MRGEGEKEKAWWVGLGLVAIFRVATRSSWFCMTTTWHMRFGEVDQEFRS